jgi:hypothetical protein
MIEVDIMSLVGFLPLFAVFFIILFLYGIYKSTDGINEQLKEQNKIIKQLLKEKNNEPLESHDKI